MRSGFDCFAAWSAASPSLAVISFTSSPANVMLTACWMVLESSARSRVLGMRGASTAESQGVQGYRGRGKLSKPREITSFSRIFAPETREARPTDAPPRKRPAMGQSVIQVVAAAVIHTPHSANATHAAHASHPDAAGLRRL